MESPASATLNEPPASGTYEFSHHPQWEYLPISYLFVVVVSSTLQVVRNWGYKTRQMCQITLHAHQYNLSSEIGTLVIRLCIRFVCEEGRHEVCV